jgi:hypothetical protein
MHIPRKYLLAGAGIALLCAGVAEAATAKLHTMTVDAPDGGTIQVHYTGDVAPQVHFVPASPAQIAMVDPFAQMQRVSAAMDAQMQAMMQRAALMQQQAVQLQQAAQSAGSDAVAGNTMPGLTMVGTLPQGVHVSYYSSSTDARGCTRSVSYSSDGSGAQPKLTQAASNGCETAAPRDTIVQAKAQAPAAAPAPGVKI